MSNSIAAALRAAGIQFVDQRVRPRSGSYRAGAVMWHHTASAPGRDAPALGIVRNGRSDLPGPLCHILISRSGIVYLITDWGRANHGGSGSCGVQGDVNNRRPVKGAAYYRDGNNCGANGWSIGIEVENNGIGEPYSVESYDSQVQVGAALSSYFGIDPLTQHIDHQEWSTRKIDRAHLSRGPVPKSRDQFRRDVNSYAGGGPGDDDLPLNDADKAWITQTIYNVLDNKLFRDSEGDPHVDMNKDILNAVQNHEGDVTHTTINTVRHNQDLIKELE